MGLRTTDTTHVGSSQLSTKTVQQLAAGRKRDPEEEEEEAEAVSAFAPSTSAKLSKATKLSAVASGTKLSAAAASETKLSEPREPKRRKISQQKRTVLVPVVGNGGRSSSEDVPADLWAWRKYGQKPIKGSPYPRGYYRCSSSKGCLARKQVERSHKDPSKLIVSYSAEHNHPWPAHRNSLAGSTRVTTTTTSATKLAKGELSAADHNQACNITRSTTILEKQQQQKSSSTVTKIKSDSDPEHAAPCHDHHSHVPAGERAGHEEEEKFANGSSANEESKAADVNSLYRCSNSSSFAAMEAPDDDFFAELEEVKFPDNSSMAAFGWGLCRSSFLITEDQSDDDDEAGVGSTTNFVDPYNLFCWSRTTSSVESKAGI